MGHFPWDTMTSGWVKGMLTGTRTFPLPDMIQLPADWKKHQPKADTMVAAFIQRAPSFHDQFPGNDREKAGGAFPSPRSWLMFATARAALISVGAEHSDVARCAMAFVGEAAAAAYAEWEKALDLPDPEELLRAAIDQKQGGKELTFVVPDRGDLVLMVLQSLGEAVAGRNTKERWEAAMDIAARIWDRWKEISIIGASRLAECYRKGYTMDSRFVKEALEVAAKAGIIKR